MTTTISKIVVASGNKGKLREFEALFAGKNVELIPQTTLNVSSVEETGLSFVENAIIKARHASQQTGLPALADDSGLEVDALDGEPGIYSARYSGEDATDDLNNEKLLHALNGIPDQKRTARFQCVIVFLRYANDPMPFIAQGTWEGHIAHKASGNNGFGYDSVFWLNDYGCTSAELESEEKNRISHRGQAIRRFYENFF